MSQRRATPEEMAEKARRDAIRDRLDPNRQQRESYQSLPDTMSEEAKRAITFQRFYPDKARQGLDYFGNPIDSNQTNPNYYGDELPDFLTSSPTMPFDPQPGLEKPQGPMVPMDPTSKKLYDDMMGTGGFLPGNPKPSDYDRDMDFGFLGDMEKPQGPMIPPEDLDRPPQIYRPPADDPRDPRTKGMYPTGGFDYPPIAPTPTDPIVPQMPSPLDPGPSFDDRPSPFSFPTPLAPTGISPDPFMMGGIMSQAPSSMTDPFSMDMMASPMNFGQASESQAGPSASSYMAPSPVPTLSASNNNFSNYLTGGMGTGMSAGGGIMSMANPMQSQMAMMPQQMMQQGGYAPRPQTMQQPVAQSLSYGQTPANSQSLYGTQTGSQNNQQSLYGPQHNSPFGGASRGYYA
jgi:hypothetical protein